MRVMVIVKATPRSEKGEMPSEQLMQEMTAFNEELVAAGVMKMGEGLRPSSEAKRIHFKGRDRIVTDGPFAETKELIAGFWLWEVASMEEAVQWVKRCPNPMQEDSDVDIRPIYEMADFAESDPQGIVAEKETRMKRAFQLQESTVQSYLFFGGRCEEAISFYEKVIGATVCMKMRFSDSPDPVPEGMLQAGFEDKIMHCSFTVGQTTVNASDGCGDQTNFDGFRLTILVPTEEAAEDVFNDLAEGGTIDMPLAKTFWSPRYGMLTDKFGVGWMVMVPGETP